MKHQKNSGLLTAFQSAIRLETIFKTSKVKAAINICLECDIAKKKIFQMINNNGKRFNVKFLKKETVPSKNESS